MHLAVASQWGLRPAGTGGWIGSWAPGIGDPTLVGWLTVVVYFAAAALSAVVMHARTGEMSRLERRLWQVLMIGLVGLGINKQLDLQSALTELGRIVANDSGWYEQRRRVQRVFILGVGLVSFALGCGLLFSMRRMPPATRVTMLGACALLAFVLVRASSFHHVDLFIRASFWGIRGNWLLEVGGLLIILTGSLWRALSSRAPTADAHATAPARG